MVYKFFDKKSKGSGFKSAIEQNEQIAEELHKLPIGKFEKRKLYSSFKDDIWGAVLADMQLISKFDKFNKFVFYYVLLKFLVNMHGLLF